MPMPEQETTLRIRLSPETRIINGVEISPQSFTKSALKQIVRSQIFAERPKNMLVEGRYATSFWSSSYLRSIRWNYKGQERLRKIEALARELKRSDKILFEEPALSDLNNVAAEGGSQC